MQNLVLANGTKAKQWWQKTPIYPLMKIYIFNYTNAEAYLSGKENILRLQELGPITYREMSEKVDLVHHEDGTITYKVSFILLDGVPDFLCTCRKIQNAPPPQ